jgi:hypothetical protein
MKRRQFLASLGAAAGAAAIAKPGIAQRPASRFRKSLDTIYSPGETAPIMRAPSAHAR